MQEELLHEPESADLRDYFRPVWQRKWLILAVVVIVTAGTYVFYDQKPRIYQSSTKIYVEASQVDQILFNSNVATFRDDRNTQNQATLLKTRETARVVAQKIGWKGAPEALLGLVTASADTGTDFLTITARGDTPQEAADIANGFANAFIEVRSAAARDRARTASQLAQGQLDALPKTSDFEEQRQELQTKIQQYKVVQDVPSGSAEVLDSAEPNGAAIAPKPSRNATFALVLSLLASVAAAFGLERFDRRIKRIEDVDAAFGVSLLAAIPHDDEPESMVEGENALSSTFRESFRGLRTNLQLMALDKPMGCVMITSAVPGEGKSTVVRNLALAYREWGLRVVVVDCDLRRNNMIKTFHVDAQAGLTDVLTGGADLADALTEVPVSVRGLQTLAQIRSSGEPANGVNGTSENGHGSEIGVLDLLSAGGHAANPQAVLATSQFEGLLRSLRDDYDMVLIDTAPVLAVSDAIPLLQLVDGVVIVSRLNQTTRDAAKRLMEILRRARVFVVGSVANDIAGLEMRGGYTYYGYRYGYGYGGRKHHEVPPDPIDREPETAAGTERT